MAKKMPILRVAGPTLLVSLILFSACTVTAIFLYRLHAQTAESLTDDIDSRRNAVETETTLRKLVKLVASGGSDGVEVLHEEVHDVIEEARRLTNSDTEAELVGQLARTFDRYLTAWGNGQIKQALEILEKEAIPAAARLRSFNTQQIAVSEEALRGTVKWIAWALVLVGTIGSLAGILLGYGVARALRHSIYRLSVSIRDAADKLRDELPAVTVTRGDGIDYLQTQMQSLVHDIERVVGRLQQRDRELLRAEQMAAVGQLAAGVAHELRNPLTAVKMLVQASREDLAQRGVPVEDLALIEQEIRRLERSLQGFLDFARPPKMEWRTIDLGQVVQAALTLVGGRARQQKVTVDLAAPERAVRLPADVEQLRQIFVNLAMNALDAMPHGGRLTVRVDMPQGAGFVAVRVIDAGPGISAELLPRLFQPFVSGKETGLGLGLVTSRRIAESHGGTLTAEALPEGGACFTLRLPLNRPAPVGLGPESELARADDQARTLTSVPAAKAS